MAIEKLEGVILRVRPQGETSKILTAFTPRRGLVSLIAKGARSPKSKFGGGLEVANRVQLVYYHRDTRDLQILSQVDILERFQRVQSGVGRLALAEACFEILLRTESGQQASGRLYDLLVQALRGLEKGEQGLRNVFRSFVLHFLAESGVAPQLGSCRRCGRVEVPTRLQFDVEHGGYVCDRCAPESRTVVPAGGRTLEWARWLGQVSPEKAAVAISQRTAAELDRWLQLYLAYHFDTLQNLRSLVFLNGLGKVRGDG